MPSLLIVDDEPAIQHAFRRALRDEPLTLRFADTAASAVDAFSEQRPDAVVLDVRLPDATGLDTYRRLKGLDERVPVVLITGHGTTDLAIEAIKEGAYEYLLKPLELDHLREIVARAVRSGQLMQVPAVMPEVESAPADGDYLIGRCPAMQEVYKAIGRVAATDATVLILGESGTGKELVARAVYQHSKRASKPFLAINCGAIPETLLESELFGHERGAFTGAERRRIGKFEQCNGGTLFLDEVGETSPLTQAKLLRVVQEQAFERVGGEETVRTDVRLIAATNADLAGLVEDGKFRRDLYFRLNVFTITLPPLRDRGDDLGRLVEHFARRFGQALGKPIAAVDPDVLPVLQNYPWPGNVRELQSVIQQAVLHAHGPVLRAEHLPPLVTKSPDAPSAGTDWDAWVNGRIAGGSHDIHAEAIHLVEREVLLRVLRHTGGNQLQAAKLLGITRGSLRTKVRALGISIGHKVSSEDDQGE